MCGRMFQTLPLHRLIAIARASKVHNQESYNGTYNICPTAYIPAIRSNRRFVSVEKCDNKEQDQESQAILVSKENGQQKELTFMKWGHQSKHNFIINSRAQELTQKRTFMNFIENRCVVIMQGYFEWNQKKQPYMFKPKNSDHLLVAALYSDNNQIMLLTKDATEDLKKVHHRMPVILNEQDVEVWLNPDNTKHISKIIENSFLKKEKQVWKNVGITKLGPHVNSIKQKSIKCLMSIEEYKKQLDKNGLMRFWKKPPVQQVGKDSQILVNQSIVQKKVMQQKQQRKEEPKKDILKEEK